MTTLSEHIAVVTELDSPENSSRAGRALHFVLNLKGTNAQRDLANALDVSRQTLHNWRNRGVPTGPMGRIADQYEMPVEVFYSEDHLDATRWLLEHRSEQFRCTERTLEKD